ncbi:MULTISPECIES: 30S ribosomal protein S17 [Candidatus Nitrosocaldus]|jgi:small subunit ribosomal protein S17|uniref:Small ribosomal subunit protein uS17 n=1 Tax=Candidatus Nitrosocaldus cavascurensis TaxID=2058097 RepID=A0A2K5AQT2_9ARCH|nr:MULTISPECIES: 30S ribosomal protein S17 [Candidatus Nitrosocaldus]SPC34001.1 30S ribosomal protein S17 [Candidatus Nitrosocaldus cavascurensis]
MVEGDANTNISSNSSNSKARSIGLEVTLPSRSCNDLKCPFHGRLSIRGRLLTGIVVSKKAKKMVVIERYYQQYIKKYKRYERRRSKIHAYLPECIDVEEGDEVLIGECRPLSKTVAFALLEVRKKRHGR